MSNQDEKTTQKLLLEFLKDVKNVVIRNQKYEDASILRDLEKIHLNMKKELLNDGIEILDIYICPHHWEEDCSCRKPKPGMIDNICNLFPVDMESSYLVGDSDVDRLLARHFGLKFIQINNNDNVKNKLLLNFRDISNDYN